MNQFIQFFLLVSFLSSCASRDDEFLVITVDERQTPESLEKALETNGTESTSTNEPSLSSEMKKEIRYQSYLTTLLTQAINKIEGIVDTEVELKFPEGESGKSNTSATIVIKHTGILDNPDYQLMIKRLAVAVVQGLQPENVTIISTKVESSSEFKNSVGQNS
ncbi:hypothetical protein PHSC3_001238 [Chlamydiales bacterium STE3]|nr:hypothetical protein PHSC3_001238 [Chlamydiales bacterium STE3]